jgi:hypothetical protein
VAGFTKADFDNQYDIGAEGEWGHPGGTTEIRVHYQRKVLQDRVAGMWSALIPVIPLVASDIVVIAGAAFGWSADYVAGALPGINIVGVDISDYVEASKDADDTSEIEEYIAIAGVPSGDIRAQRVRAKYTSPGVNKATQVVLNEDMKTNQSRNKVRQALGNNTPTHVITEDMIQVFTDPEIADWVFELNKLTTTEKIHIISGEGDRTAEEINALTGHRVIVATSAGVLKDVP